MMRNHRFGGKKEMMFSRGSRQSRICLRNCLIGFSIALTLSLFGSALHWKINKGTKLGQYHNSNCSPCICDCPTPFSILKLGPGGLANLSIEDCGKSDPDLKNEMEKQYSELLMEELELQEVVAQEQIQHMNATYQKIRRTTFQYQQETHKCTTAIETCEEARERVEALTRREIKLASLWEQRARKMGWEAY